LEKELLKLHLGCGERYIPGYLNIDFPPSSHNVQQVSVADQCADILSLRYERDSVNEIRSHHVFEHFPRPIACAMLSCWSSWLKPEGILHLEVPDLGKLALTILNPLASLRDKSVAERHAFGSHEAGWAHHYEGYSLGGLRAILSTFRFEEVEATRNHWKGTHNIEVISRKAETIREKNDFERAAESYLRNFLVDDSPGEERLLQVWMEEYREQVEKGWPTA
jgi:hypothetical protein